jgi:hypothetical protein
MGLVDQVCDSLRDSGWSFVAQRAIGRITLKVSTEERKTYSVIIHVREEACIIIGLFIYPRKCDPEHFQEMLTFLNQQNFELLIGGFEMDPNTGALKFRNSIDLESTTVSAEFLDHFVRLLSSLGARYAAALEAVIDGQSLEAAKKLLS